MSKAKIKTAAANDFFQGTVDGIDVHAFEGQPVRCFAVLNNPPRDPLQVVAYEPRLQSALELASAKKCEVEVNFRDDGTYKVVTRVRLLDR